MVSPKIAGFILIILAIIYKLLLWLRILTHSPEKKSKEKKKKICRGSDKAESANFLNIFTRL